MAEADGWITLGQAAKQAGISVDAMRRRVRKGSVPARQIRTDRGPTWVVDPSAVATMAPATVNPAPTVDAMVALAPLVAMVERLQADLLARTEAAALWQARAEHWQALAEQARLALQAPAVAVESAPEQSAPSAPATRPWWAFWRG